MHKLKFLLLLGSLLLIACSNRSTFAPLQPEAGNEAVIYIYRPASIANIAVNPQFELNGKNLFTLPNGQHQLIRLAEGEYQFNLKLDERYIGNQSILLKVEPQQHYFLRVTTQVKFEKNRPFTRRFDIQQVDNPIALNEIRQTRYGGKILNADQPDNSGDAQPQPKEDSFSISKTRNPFSK